MEEENQQQESSTSQKVGNSVRETRQKKLGKFASSKKLAIQCFHLLKKDKEVIWFPILSAVISGVIFIALAGLVLFSPLRDALPFEKDVELSLFQTVTFYGIIFVFYFIGYFVVTFFQTGLTAVVYGRLQGGDLSFKDGIKASLGIIGKLFVYALFASTIGIILRVLFDRSKALGKSITWLLGFAWNLATFFIAPTLLLDNVGVQQSIKNSGNLFKKTWGETLILTISLSIFYLLFFFYGLIVYLVFLIILVTLDIFSFPIIIGVSITVALIILLLSIIVSSLSAIFKVVLYNYAKNNVIAEGFSSEYITNVVQQNSNTLVKDNKIKKSYWYRYVIVIMFGLLVAYWMYYAGNVNDEFVPIIESRSDVEQGKIIHLNLANGYREDGTREIVKYLETEFVKERDFDDIIKDENLQVIIETYETKKPVFVDSIEYSAQFVVYAAKEDYVIKARIKGEDGYYCTDPSQKNIIIADNADFEVEDNCLGLPLDTDSDNDGIKDTFEIRLGTDPNNPDTDGDGYNDLEELNSGNDPLGL